MDRAASLHEFLQGSAEFIDGSFVSTTDILRDTAFDMAGEKLTVKSVQCRLDGADLSQNVHAVALVVHHLADAADLPFNAV